MTLQFCTGPSWICCCYFQCIRVITEFISEFICKIQVCQFAVTISPGRVVLSLFPVYVGKINFQSWINVFAMITNAIAMATLLILINYEVISLAWSWLIVLGTATTFLTALLLGYIASAIKKLLTTI